MIVHPCDLSVKPLLSKGTKGNSEGGSNRDWGPKGVGGGATGYWMQWKALFSRIASFSVRCALVLVSKFRFFVASKSSFHQNFPFFS